MKVVLSVVSLLLLDHGVHSFVVTSRVPPGNYAPATFHQDRQHDNKHPNNHNNHALFGYRQGYQYSLEKLMETGNVELNGRQVSVDTVSEQMTQDLEAAQSEEAEAESRRQALEAELQSKEEEQAAISEAISSSSSSATSTSSSTHLQQDPPGRNPAAEAIEKNPSDDDQPTPEKNAAIIEDYKAREIALRKEMDILAAKLVKEEEHIRQTRDMSNRILQARIDIDIELSLLKKKYKADSLDWEKKLKTEQEAHRMDLLRSQREFDQLQNEIGELQMQAMMAQLSVAQADVLAVKLNDAEEKTNRIQQKRIELDGELSTLKRKYDNDRMLWMKSMEKELSTREQETAKSIADMEKLQEEMANMKAERSDVGSLLGLAFKAMFGVID